MPLRHHLHRMQADAALRRLAENRELDRAAREAVRDALAARAANERVLRERTR